MSVLFMASVDDLVVVDVPVVVDEGGGVTGAGEERDVVEGAVGRLELAGGGAKELVETSVIVAAVSVMGSVIGATVLVEVLVVGATVVVMTEALVTVFNMDMVVRVVRGISFVVRVLLGLELVVVVLGSLTPFRHVPRNDFC